MIAFHEINLIFFFKEKPQSIELEEKKPLEIELDQVKTITCKVLDGMPKSTIIWKLNDPANGQAILLNNSLNNYDEEMSTSRIALKGTLNIRGKQLTCLVEHPLINKSFSSSVDINLKCKIAENFCCQLNSIFFVVFNVFLIFKLRQFYPLPLIQIWLKIKPKSFIAIR